MRSSIARGALALLSVAAIAGCQSDTKWTPLWYNPFHCTTVAATAPSQVSPPPRPSTLNNNPPSGSNYGSSMTTGPYSSYNSPNTPVNYGAPQSGFGNNTGYGYAGNGSNYASGTQMAPNYAGSTYPTGTGGSQYLASNPYGQAPSAGGTNPGTGYQQQCNGTSCPLPAGGTSNGYPYSQNGYPPANSTLPSTAYPYTGPASNSGAAQLPAMAPARLPVTARTPLPVTERVRLPAMAPVRRHQAMELAQRQATELAQVPATARVQQHQATELAQLPATVPVRLPAMARAGLPAMEAAVLLPATAPRPRATAATRCRPRRVRPAPPALEELPQRRATRLPTVAAWPAALRQAACPQAAVPMCPGPVRIMAPLPPQALRRTPRTPIRPPARSCQSQLRRQPYLPGSLKTSGNLSPGSMSSLSSAPSGNSSSSGVVPASYTGFDGSGFKYYAPGGDLFSRAATPALLTDHQAKSHRQALPRAKDAGGVCSFP